MEDDEEQVILTVREKNGGERELQLSSSELPNLMYDTHMDDSPKQNTKYVKTTIEEGD